MSMEPELAPRDPVVQVLQRTEMLAAVWRDLDEFYGNMRLGSQTWPELRLGFDPEAFMAALGMTTRLGVAALWGTEVDRQMPDRIVSCRSPGSTVARLLYPALDLWEGLAHACWDTANGFFEFRRYRSQAGRDEAALSAMGIRCDWQSYQEIWAALHDARTGIPSAFSWEALFSTDAALVAEREQTFVKLRDLVTAHRRSWADAWLEEFLVCNWREPLASAAETYDRRLIERNGKPPTVKQSAPIAWINNWLGGHVEPYYELIGHPREYAQVNHEIAISDLERLIDGVLAAFGLTECAEPDRASAHYRPASRSRDATLRAEFKRMNPALRGRLLRHQLRRRIQEVRRKLELGQTVDSSDPTWLLRRPVRLLAGALGMTHEGASSAVDAEIVRRLTPAD